MILEIQEKFEEALKIRATQYGVTPEAYVIRLLERFGCSS
jgi:hypothetical protein